MMEPQEFVGWFVLAAAQNIAADRPEFECHERNLAVEMTMLDSWADEVRAGLGPRGQEYMARRLAAAAQREGC